MSMLTNLNIDVLLLLGLVDLLLLLVDHGLQVVLVVLEQHALLLVEPLVLLLLAQLVLEGEVLELLLLLLLQQLQLPQLLLPEVVLVVETLVLLVTVYHLRFKWFYIYRLLFDS